MYYELEYMISNKNLLCLAEKKITLKQFNLNIKELVTT